MVASPRVVAVAIVAAVVAVAEDSAAIVAVAEDSVADVAAVVPPGAAVVVAVVDVVELVA